MEILGSPLQGGLSVNNVLGRLFLAREESQSRTCPAKVGLGGGPSAVPAFLESQTLLHKENADFCLWDVVAGSVKKIYKKTPKTNPKPDKIFAAFNPRTSFLSPQFQMKI